MKVEIAEALLQRVLEDSTIRSDDIDGYRKYFQQMAKYKYDNYEQYATGMRFIEKLALWLNSIDDQDKEAAIQFIKNRVVFISAAEMRLLVESCFPDMIKQKLMESVGPDLGLPHFAVNKIVKSEQYVMLLRRSLFLGMSDGARMDEFRRANTGVISHEQIYQTYELSEERAKKMIKELKEDFLGLFGRSSSVDEETFQRLFLLDDFSASGTSYLKYDTEKKELKGKIAGLYKSLFNNTNKQWELFDRKNLKVYVIIYLCTQQAKDAIEENFQLLYDEYGHKPELLTLHLLPNSFKLNATTDPEIFAMCEKDKYYDKELEDKHTSVGGKNVKLGFGGCALPLILHHNSPNNSVAVLWAYENAKFEGLFPRIPRHVAL